MPAEIQKLSKADETKARALLARVDGLLDRAKENRENQERTFVEIGIALLDVKNTQAWLLSGQHSFDSYVKGCETRFGKSRTQLYGAKAVAERLLPAVSKEQLIDMGISRAMPLAMYVKNTGKSAQPLVASALDPQKDVTEFRAEIAEAAHAPTEKGKWYDLGGFFCSAPEREEIERVFAQAGSDLPAEAPDWMRRKVVVQRLVAEFVSAWPCTENV